MSVLFCGIDGWDLSLADYYDHPFWQSIRDEVAIAKIPQPDAIENGEISHASSPRLWAELFTGVGPYRAGPLGFWEKINGSGDVQRANVSREWIYEHQCEKLVDRQDMLVPPVWEHAAAQGYTIGTTSAWFSYPLPDSLIEHIDGEGGWILTDFPFPMDSEYLDEDRVAHPTDAYPSEGFTEEVGAGFRVNTMVERDPEGLYEQMLQQDKDRYQYTLEQIEERGAPDFCLVYTRSTDGMAHQFAGANAKREHFPEHLTDSVENFRSIYRENFDGIQALWETGEFDHLLIGGDHGTVVEFENGEPHFPHGTSDHDWPAEWAILSPEVSSGVELRAEYTDIAPTALDLLGVTPTQVETDFDGVSLVGQAAREENLRELGYMP